MASIGHPVHDDEITRSRIDAPPASDLEKALLTAASNLRRERFGLRAHVDLEALAVQLMEAAMREQHQFVLCSAVDPAAPTREEHRWAQSIAGAVAGRFQRTARRVMRSLKGEAPAPVVDLTRDDEGCPSWCVRYGVDNGCDWHESRPVAFNGPGDMYDENPEPYEVLWATISEVPQDEVDAGAKPGPYLYFDTLSVGQGSRMDVPQTDALIRRLTRYVIRLREMRDQLAALTASED
jgi:hypothetical protein